jgi:hypothetical protein
LLQLKLDRILTFHKPNSVQETIEITLFTLAVLEIAIRVGWPLEFDSQHARALAVLERPQEIEEEHDLLMVRVLAAGEYLKLKRLRLCEACSFERGEGYQKVAQLESVFGIGQEERAFEAVGEDRLRDIVDRATGAKNIRMHCSRLMWKPEGITFTYAAIADHEKDAHGSENVAIDVDLKLVW